MPMMAQVSFRHGVRRIGHREHTRRNNLATSSQLSLALGLLDFRAQKLDDNSSVIL